MPRHPRIGILALQGDFKEHVLKLRALGAEAFEIRRAKQLDEIDALILPGGESTTIAILESAEADFAKDNPNHIGIFDAIKLKAESSMPIWGTCMGSILLARDIEGSKQGRLALMNISVRRNAFGPQRFSSEVPLSIPKLGEETFPGVFIRAPLITSTGKEVEILGQIPEGVVMARQGNYLATVFHPEVVDDTRVHDYFLGMI
jgi:pyridoxal 5'-phosphate synthase pdxT subunit